MTYVVDAPLVLARDQERRVHHYYAGAVIPWLDEDQRAHFLELGLVHEVIGNASAVESDSAGGGDPSDLEDDRPASSAKKAELVSWLVTNAVDVSGDDYDAAELDKLTKDRLWELINATDDV